jgi:tRNA nucleotidyltransferase (CCA-adding enzyme)
VKLVATRPNADFDSAAALLACLWLPTPFCVLPPFTFSSSVHALLQARPRLLAALHAHVWSPDGANPPNELWLLDTTVVPVDAPQQLPIRRIDRQELAATLGATTSYLVRELMQQGVFVDAEQATVLLLGIAEATGALASHETTDADRACVRWLLDYGADMSAVQHWLLLDPDDLLAGLTASSGPPANIAPLLETRLDAGLLALLKQAAALAEGQGAGLYLVGGAVRDLLLNKAVAHSKPTDLDVVVEGDALALAGALRDALGGEVRHHAAFGTATLLLPDSSLDFVGARSEAYPHPAALPVVTPARLRHDMHRRDFTVNTLVAALGPASYGALRDYYGARRDIERRLLRVLHRQSFVDDPTRLLRLVRLAARLDFAIEAGTRALVGAAVAADLLARTSPARITNELGLLFNEPAPERCLALLDELGLLQALHPALRWDARLAERFVVARHHEWPAAVLAPTHVGTVAHALPDDARKQIITRYQLGPQQARVLRETAAIQKLRPLLSDPHIPNSALDRLLQRFETTSLRIAYLMENAQVARAIQHYIAQLRPVAIALTGNDLIALGVKPGPRIGALLAQLRAARLDGNVATPDGERAWVMQQLVLPDADEAAKR